MHSRLASNRDIYGGSPEETIHEANWLDWGVFTPVTDLAYGGLIVAQSQHKMTESPIRTKCVSWPVGYDNEQVYLKYMGFGPRRLKVLREAGIV